MPSSVMSSYLAALGDHELDHLAERLSPDVRLALASHVARARSLSPPPSPRAAIPAPSRTTGEHTDFDLQPGLPLRPPLLSHQELKSVLPAVVPSARRWLIETDRAAREVMGQQKTLQEMGRHVVKTEQRRDHAEARAATLHHVVEQQSSALIASAARCASLREALERQRAELQREQQRSQQLERGLRAASRERDALRGQRPASVSASGGRSSFARWISSAPSPPAPLPSAR
mmetsp:Transcript_31298/g.81771  ORF Transcript_31298/g.81771 Transcript_31298/m.81771 type:complete len:232 (-) Transcript_31298:489-1184(-)